VEVRFSDRRKSSAVTRSFSPPSDGFKRPIGTNLGILSKRGLQNCSEMRATVTPRWVARVTGRHLHVLNRSCAAQASGRERVAFSDTCHSCNPFEIVRGQRRIPPMNRIASVPIFNATGAHNRR
jgi:hypothetical protein